jgi:hypothetical protein
VKDALPSARRLELDCGHVLQLERPTEAHRAIATFLKGTNGAMNPSGPLPTGRDDLENRDPDYVREMLPMFWMIATFWFRADVPGLDKIVTGHLTRSQKELKVRVESRQVS